MRNAETQHPRPSTDTASHAQLLVRGNEIATQDDASI